MKRSLFTMTLAALGALGIAHAQPACSKSTLTGGYGLTLLGSTSPNNAAPIAVVGGGWSSTATATSLFPSTSRATA
jgi:hypothetical protein